MNPVAVILVVIGGYLFGSISLARLITRRIAPDSDLEQVQVQDFASGGTRSLSTYGATTASIAFGPRVGGAIAMLDILKGFILALGLSLLFPGSLLYLYAGLAIVAGHIWPVFYRFKGGGGLSPALGVLLAVDPVGLLVCVVIAFIVGIFLVREIFVAVMGGTWLFVLWIGLRTGDWQVIALCLLLNVMMGLAVVPDIRAHLASQKAGNADLSMSMDTIPMGRMMKKMMERMGVPLRGRSK